MTTQILGPTLIESLISQPGYLPTHTVAGGFIPIGGFPGSVRITDGYALYAKPSDVVAEVARTRLQPGLPWALRADLSTYWHDRGQVPIQLHDIHRISKVFLTTIPWWQYEIFAGR